MTSPGSRSRTTALTASTNGRLGLGGRFVTGDEDRVRAERQADPRTRRMRRSFRGRQLGQHGEVPQVNGDPAGGTEKRHGDDRPDQRPGYRLAANETPAPQRATVVPTPRATSPLAR